MTKAELVDEIVKNLNGELSSSPTEAATVIVNGFIKAVSEAVAAGKTVSMRGFGSFQPVKRAEKVARIIKTGAPLVVPAHMQPVFVASKEFKDAVRVAVPVDQA